MKFKIDIKGKSNENSNTVEWNEKIKGEPDAILTCLVDVLVKIAYGFDVPEKALSQKIKEEYKNRKGDDLSTK